MGLLVYCGSPCASPSDEFVGGQPGTATSLLPSITDLLWCSIALTTKNSKCDTRLLTDFRTSINGFRTDWHSELLGDVEASFILLAFLILMVGSW